MRISWRRIAGLPAMRILLFFALGILLQWHFPLPGRTLLAAAVAMLVLTVGLAIAASRRRALRPLRDATLLPLLLLCGMLRTADALEVQVPALLRWADLPDKRVLTGVVADEVRMSADRQRFRLSCRSIDTDSGSVPVEGCVLVSWRRSRYDAHDTLRPLRRGDRVRLRGRLRTPLPPRQPGGFDARRWLIGTHCLLQCSVSKGSDLAVTGHYTPGVFAEAVHAVRHFTRHALGTLYAARHSAVMAGLLLGDRSGIDDDVMEDFRRSGIMHILAVSGLHAGIILLLVFIPTERLPYPLRALLAAAGLWAFAAVTGFAPPVTRAAVMGSLAMGGVVLQRTGSAVNALAAAGLIILMTDPLELTGLSFQLSFTAVLGILLFHERVSAALLRPLPRAVRRRNITQKAAALLSLTISAQALSLPLLLDAFGQASPAGLLTNLAAVPLVFVVVSCGVLAVGAFPLSPWLADCFAATSAACLDGILSLSHALASLPGATVALPHLPVPLLLACVSAVIYISFSQGRLRQKAVLILLAFAALSALTPLVQESDEGNLRVTFLDVGQGDAAVIELPGGGAMLIDAGPGGDGGDAGSRNILPWLRRRGIEGLRGLLITHPDEDHRGGALSVLRGVAVDTVYVGGRWSAEGAAAALDSAMRVHARGVRDVRSGERLDLDEDVRLLVLSPPGGNDIEAGNGNSVVLLLIYGATRFLFTGDVDAEAERRMLREWGPLLQADVLKVGHHGSTTSSCPAFVLAVRPAHAVISAGRNNHFRHPRAEILTRLRLAGARISRTDVEGTLSFVSDGRRIVKDSGSP
ncbi:MAG: DNA internalization-related competence protein ComEC/Rec2 [Bacteroidota bacterium]|nr:DNA internalization-related competence protein ComEC/Rec2 [Bacteroidota bacterium]